MNKKLFMFPLIVAVLFSCSEFNFVNEYDEVIDKGITDFAEQFNTHVKNMGDLAGTPEGTYEANFRAYNALDSKLDVMISRTSVASDGKGCKIDKKAFNRVQHLLETNMPGELLQGESASTGNPSGCNEKLLGLVKKQLAFVKEIHKSTDKCGEKKLSCLRPATAKTALGIANQSITAVSVVEAAKKKQGARYER